MKKLRLIKWLPSTATLTILNKEESVNENLGKSTAAFCFIFDKNNNIILLEHTNKLRGYDIPGGHIEKDESPLEAMKREVLEEIGCTIKNIKLIGYQKIEKTEPEEKYPELLSNQVFFTAELEQILNIKLEDDSKGLYKMNVEKYFHYLVKEGKEELIDLFNLSLNE